MAQNIPEGSVLRDDGCVCPADAVKKNEDECKSRSRTCPPDPRFPNQNQTKHCYVSFIDYQRCARLLGDYPGCLLFYQCYRALCPNDWVDKWFDQMEKGNFPKKIYPLKPIVRPPNDLKVCDDDEDEPDEIC